MTEASLRGVGLLRAWSRRALIAATSCCALMLMSCAPTPTPRSGNAAVTHLRQIAAESQDADTLAEWLLAELWSPGGTAAGAVRARKRLDALHASGMLPSLARGVDDAFHGRLHTAPDHFLEVLKHARNTEHPHGPLIAWYAANRAVTLHDATPDLWQQWGDFVQQAIKKPGRLGWRARDALLDWWVAQAWHEGTAGLKELARKRFGCVSDLRVAGPFGSNVPSDSYRHFPAEAPGPWPARWPRELAGVAVPKILKTKRHGCSVQIDEPVPGGIFYAESFIDLPAQQDLILVAPSAYSLWVNDALVLERDIRTWGTGLRAGVRLRLPAGRHRVLARTSSTETALRVLHPNGTPLAIRSSTDAALSYSTALPSAVSDPNLLWQFIGKGNVLAPDSDLVRFCAAFLALLERHADVASVLHDPLVRLPAHATGPSLHQASLYIEGDPIFDRNQRSDLVRELNQLALQKDSRLWAAQLDLISRTAENKGLTEATRALEKLQQSFPHVPGIGTTLSSVYGQLGWRPEYVRTVKALEQQFPHNAEVLHSAVEIYKDEGDHASVDRLTARIRKLDPDSEIAFTQALEREDYDAAIDELGLIAARRPEREELTRRMDDLTISAGRKEETAQRLSALIRKDPQKSSSYLALADLQYAQGNTAALHEALASAVQSGADYGLLAEAIDLVEGASELEPYRLDAHRVIASYEKLGQHLAGTAARVLDYAVVWVRADGSSRMLEHEIIRIQSAEAIARFAEQKLDGLILHMRVIKQDGRTLEPEPVEGKPTLTFPHLEVGDYIETEQIQYFRGDGVGQQYSGPRWFFREENVAYAHSELVVIAPEYQPLQIETRGDVPAPTVTRDGQFVVRRWRVDHSPAAPNEPLSAPITEFLPSVNVGWGISLERRLHALNARVSEIIPVDPRITKVAQRIVKGVAPRQRARALYRWIQTQVSDGEETDGRRVVVGKNGNRWQAMVILCRALGIPVHFVVAKNRLASPSTGPLSRAAEYPAAVLKVGSGSDAVWLTLDDKYAPFGYLPAELRGMPGYQLGSSAPAPTLLPNNGAQDSILYEGDVKLAQNGSAELELVQKFQGKYAVRLRKGLAELAENRVRDVLEAQVLGRMIHGARLRKHSIANQDDADAPLVIKMTASVPAFAQVRSNGLVLAPPFAPNLAQLATLPTRQTPLLITEASHQVVRLRVTLPTGAKVSLPAATKLTYQGRSVELRDRVEPGRLILEREIQIGAGRVQPDEYPQFVNFTRGADAALSREIPITPAAE